MDDPVQTVRLGYDELPLRYRADDAPAGRYAPWIAELLCVLERGSRVLDVGCGNGVPVARDLAAAGHRVTGVDLSDVQTSAPAAWCRPPRSCARTSPSCRSQRNRSTLWSPSPR